MPFERVARAAAMFFMLAVLTSTRSGADPGPIRIGVIYAYSSNANSPLGPRFDAAVGAWFKEHGDTMAGRKVELIRRDEGGVNPENAKRLAQELVVQQHVDILAGLIFTPNAVAVGEISTQSKTPLMIQNATTSGILAPNPYAMRDSYTTAQITATARRPRTCSTRTTVPASTPERPSRKRSSRKAARSSARSVFRPMRSSSRPTSSTLRK
jgi:branched-chain amino acid transport system substrate-binding protein